jgi:hypothetical protein
MVRSMRSAAVAVAALVAVLVPAALLAGAGTELVGTVGPAFNIDLRTVDGSRVTHLDPGAFELVVNDQGEEHNFHLSGPGVDVFTPVEGTGTFRFPIALTDGTYRFICDIHPTQMRGTFTAGVVAPPPPPPPPPVRLPRLAGSVGAAAISLKRAGVNVKKTLRAGTYLLTVTDRSAKNNFHLTGRGINRKTGIAAKPRVTWRVVLRRGALYTFKSDANPKLKKTFRAV